MNRDAGFPSVQDFITKEFNRILGIKHTKIGDHEIPKITKTVKS